jgi:putative transposase
MAGKFWLSEAQWDPSGRCCPRTSRGAKDRQPAGHQRHRWQDCPSVYGPPTTVSNRFRRWTMRGIWRRLFDALARADPGDGRAIDSTTAKAHRSAAGGKRGAEAQAIGRSRGGRTTKIHAIVDCRAHR